MTFDLLNASTEFAQDVQDLLDATFPAATGGSVDERQVKVLQRAEWVVIRTGTIDKPGGIKLLKSGTPVGRLEVSFRCAPDQSGHYLATRKSSFQLSSLQEGTPLLRLDFDHQANTVPTAHWNVHAERGATSVLLARCNPKHEGLVSRVHLPVGGTRYRPCLEDFIEMLVVEFNVDTLKGWRRAVKAGRERWRTLQTRSVVRDSAVIAADVLRSLGYSVRQPVDGTPCPNLTMLHGR